MNGQSKSANEILAGLIESKNTTYRKINYKELQVKSNHALLDEILTKTPKDSELYSHLVSDYKNEMQRGVSFSPFPTWSRKIAYCLANPDLKLSNERVQLIRDYCAEVCDEFMNGKDFGTTLFLAENDDFGFLSQMAQAMLG